MIHITKECHWESRKINLRLRVKFLYTKSFISSRLHEVNQTSCRCFVDWMIPLKIFKKDIYEHNHIENIHVHIYTCIYINEKTLHVLFNYWVFFSLNNMFCRVPCQVDFIYFTVYYFTLWWIFELFPVFHDYKQSCIESPCPSIFVHLCKHLYRIDSGR